ncbi:MAG: pseudouridine synthase [Lachnospiraceae bacterium]|nr:pseudouridine synthase [Lachnospiraceae bacterium]MDD3616775.1 pseudouridine synthase [Lachnospiraceae bacterium]
MEEIRLNKYLSEAGVCSRREADRLIEQGLVTIEGIKAVTGQKVQNGQKVCVKGKEVKKQEPQVLLALYKPRGIVCTAEKREKNNIIQYINYPVRVYPVGRLDKDSEGLILLTNQGELVNQIMRARNFHEKEYVVTVDKKITAEFLKQMQEGVPILDTVTRPCKIQKSNSHTFRIILTQGLNRQIRRMCEYLGYQVQTLKRVRIMNIELGNLEYGKYRDVTTEEKKKLYQLLK